MTLSFLLILSNLIQGYLIDNSLSQTTIDAYAKAGDIADYVRETYFSLHPTDDVLAKDFHLQSFLGATPSRIIVVTEGDQIAFDSGNEYPDRIFQLDAIRLSLDHQQADSSVYLGLGSKRLMYTTLPVMLHSGEWASILYVEDIEGVFVHAKELINRMLIIGIPFVILSSILVMYSSARMLRPVNELKVGVEAMTRGRYDYEITLDDAVDDELLQITRSFNTLARRLDEIDQQQSEFVSNVSHELKTPIASMKIISQSLVEAKGQVDDEVVFDFLEDINSESDRLSEIIDDLLYIATLQKRDVALKLETRPISKAIEEAIRLIEPLAHERNIRLEIPRFEKILIEYDFNKMKQVFINLLSNAVKYTEPGGQVRVRQYADKNDVIIEIEDNGIGIPTNDLEYIFDRFYRVDKHRSRKEGGTGLGLNIVKQLLSLHDGRIEVQSETGIGSVFKVILPKRYQV